MGLGHAVGGRDAVGERQLSARHAGKPTQALTVRAGALMRAFVRRDGGSDPNLAGLQSPADTLARRWQDCAQTRHTVRPAVRRPICVSRSWTMALWETILCSRVAPT